MDSKLEKGIGWLGRLLALTRKYGFFGIVKGLMLLLLAGYVVFFALNPTYLLDRIESVRKEQHEESVGKRIASDQQVRQLLGRMLDRVQADRTWLIEFHNGSANLASGLPFLFGSMRLEETRAGIANVDDEYADFSLSKYGFMAEVIARGYFYGPVTEIEPIDERIYHKFRSNDVRNIALIALYYGDRPLGLLGISFCTDRPVDWELTGREIRNNAVKIATLLTQ